MNESLAIIAYAFSSTSDKVSIFLSAHNQKKARHRVHESLPTNIVFRDEAELDSFIIRSAYLSGKNISIASPILDASLPDGSRVQLTYGNEVTRRGLRTQS